MTWRGFKKLRRSCGLRATPKNGDAYTSVFANSKIGHVMRNGDNGPGPKGSVLVMDFELEASSFMR